jgi:hypothetical protein
VDCCSLEGRTLKDAKVVKLLTEYVLVRLEPLDWDEDLEFAHRFGVKKFPALLLLDWTGKKKLGVIGDVSPEEVAEGLAEAQGK